jgi:uncharacterized membrane protein
MELGEEAIMAARMRLVVAIVVGLAVGVLVSVLAGWRFGLPSAWAALGTVFVVWGWAVTWPFDGHETRVHALAEEPGRLVSHVTVVGLAFGSLASVATLLLGGSSSHRNAQAFLALGSCAVAWLCVQTIFTALYCELYYTDTSMGAVAALDGRAPDAVVAGGIDFDGTDEPSYHDFAYVAFTMGMCFQVSDTGFKNTTMRTVGLQHAILSYVFGTVVIATLINFVAGLGS